MEAEAFVEQLWACAPTLDNLVSEGLSHDEAEDFRRSYYFVENGSDERGSNPLLDLLTRYDGTHVEVGMVCFSKPSAYSDNRWMIGEVEADPLILDQNTQNIYVEERGTDGYVLFRCAESADEFLGAILLAARFLSRCVYDGGLYKDQAKICLQAQECAEKAGGEAYFSFYAMLVGCEA